MLERGCLFLELDALCRFLLAVGVEGDDYHLVFPWLCLAKDGGHIGVLDHSIGYSCHYKSRACT